MISNTFPGVLSEEKHLFKYARVHLVVAAVVFELESQGWVRTTNNVKVSIALLRDN